jgi:hypothetical protein
VEPWENVEKGNPSPRGAALLTSVGTAKPKVNDIRLNADYHAQKEIVKSLTTVGLP